MPEQVHIYNPYIDFKFGEHYASDFHLLRVSDGARFNSNIIPTLTDKTTEIPGADGMYFFNTYYKQRQFTINFAYEAVTEDDIRNIRKWLNGKEVKSLIFDEEPNKQYFAKVTGSPTLKYIAFDELDTSPSPSNTTEEEVGQLNTNTNTVSATTHVIFKGEGTVQFTCYDPYAYGLNPIEQVYDSSTYTYDRLFITSTGSAPTPFKVTTYNAMSEDTVIEIRSGNGSEHTENDPIIYTITLQEYVDADFEWNSATGMVKGAADEVHHDWLIRPIHYVGNGMGTLEPNRHFYITSNNSDVTFTFSFYNRYL